jgi:hypothetical protein
VIYLDKMNKQAQHGLIDGLKLSESGFARFKWMFG